VRIFWKAVWLTKAVRLQFSVRVHGHEHFAAHKPHLHDFCRYLAPPVDAFAHPMVKFPQALRDKGRAKEALLVDVHEAIDLAHRARVALRARIPVGGIQSRSAEKTVDIVRRLGASLLGGVPAQPWFQESFRTDH